LVLQERINHLERQNFSMTAEGFNKQHHEPIRSIFDKPVKFESEVKRPNFDINKAFGPGNSMGFS
jgi:hypothetical protein